MYIGKLMPDASERAAMDAKKLRKLSRSDLLEMLIELSAENDDIKAENAQLQKKLQQQQLELERASSIVEASLQINGVFTSAQRAAEQYLDNIKRMNCDAQSEAAAMLNQARAESDALRVRARLESDALYERTQQDCEQYRMRMMQEMESKSAATKGRTDGCTVQHYPFGARAGASASGGYDGRMPRRFQ